MTLTLQISHVRAAAAGIISAGYLMLQLPENWDESTFRWLSTLWRGNWQEDNIVGEETIVDTAGILRTKAKPAIVTL